MNVRFKTLIGNTMILALGSIASKIVLVILIPLYTNLLSTDQYGTGELIVTLSNLLVPFVTLSIQDAVLRFGLDQKNSGAEVIRNAVGILFCATIVLICLYPIAGLFAFTAKWRAILLFITVLNMFRTVFMLYTKAMGKMKLFVADTILYTFWLLIFNLVFLIGFDMELQGYFLAMICSATASVLFLVIKGGIAYDLLHSRKNKTLRREMVSFSVPMILNALSWWIANSADRFMILHYLTAGAVGIYTVSAKMPSLMTSITGIFTQAWVISSVTEYDTSKDKSFYEKTFRGYHFVLVFSASLITFLIRPLMQVLVGKDFIQAWQYVPCLILGAFFLAYSGFFGAIYTSAKKNIHVMITTLLAALINIGLNALTIPLLGIWGAALSTMISYLFLGLFRMLHSRKYFRFSIDFKAVFLSIMLLMVQCVAVSVDFWPITVFLVCFALLLLVNAESAHAFFVLIRDVARKAVRGNEVKK